MFRLNSKPPCIELNIETVKPLQLVASNSNSTSQFKVLHEEWFLKSTRFSGSNCRDTIDMRFGTKLAVLILNVVLTLMRILKGCIEITRDSTGDEISKAKLGSVKRFRFCIDNNAA
jgi:hypothetical protein